ncbi:uncharacterized protein HfgLR_01355 [Haloferax gibbonsii]|uniref:Uncharacterized protein n=1 Tax=Haloferax gibbonsii TaxID=35746 RepID=A0A871BCE2_HALGI|nr:uncharacterized protein HfgLR_01355 [Haloferax gibbonsii]
MILQNKLWILLEDSEVRGVCISISLINKSFSNARRYKLESSNDSVTELC